MTITRPWPASSQSVGHHGLLVLVFVAVLAQFGVETTSLLAALGNARLAIDDLSRNRVEGRFNKFIGLP